MLAAGDYQIVAAVFSLWGITATDLVKGKDVDTLPLVGPVFVRHIDAVCSPAVRL